MVNVPKKIKNLLKQPGVKKNVRIHFPNGEHDDLTNAYYIEEDSVRFTESVCSSTEGIRFGLCESSIFEATVHHVDANLKDCEIEVEIEIDVSNIELTEDEQKLIKYDPQLDFTYFPIKYGTFYIDECKQNMDRLTRDLKAYTRDHDFEKYLDPITYGFLKHRIGFKNSTELNLNMVALTASIMNSIDIPGMSCTYLGTAEDEVTYHFNWSERIDSFEPYENHKDLYLLIKTIGEPARYSRKLDKALYVEDRSGINTTAQDACLDYIRNIVDVYGFNPFKDYTVTETNFVDEPTYLHNSKPLDVIQKLPYYKNFVGSYSYKTGKGYEKNYTPVMYNYICFYPYINSDISNFSKGQMINVPYEITVRYVEKTTSDFFPDEILVDISDTFTIRDKNQIFVKEASFANNWHESFEMEKFDNDSEGTDKAYYPKSFPEADSLVESFLELYCAFGKIDRDGKFVWDRLDRNDEDTLLMSPYLKMTPNLVMKSDIQMGVLPAAYYDGNTYRNIWVDDEPIVGYGKVFASIKDENSTEEVYMERTIPKNIKTSYVDPIGNCTNIELVVHSPLRPLIFGAPYYFVFDIYDGDPTQSIFVEHDYGPVPGDYVTVEFLYNGSNRYTVTERVNSKKQVLAVFGEEGVDYTNIAVRVSYARGYACAHVNHVVVDVEEYDYDSLNPDYKEYDLSDNYFVSHNMLTKKQLKEVFTRYYENLAGFSYTPMTLEGVGLPYLEAGDIVQVTTPNGRVFRTHILRHEIDGEYTLIHDIETN